MRIKNPATYVLLAIVITSIVGIYFTSSGDNLKNVTFSISSALLISSIFYFGTVLVPSIQRNRRAARILKERYKSFKLACIDLFLIASNSQEYEEHENLLNHKEFRRYFQAKTSEFQNRWDLVTTSIDNQDYIFKEIVTQLEFLSIEISQAKSASEFHDDEVEDYFTYLTRTIHRTKMMESGSDDYKSLCRFLWSIFTRWNFIEGQLQEDVIDKMIEKLNVHRPIGGYNSEAVTLLDTS